VHISCAIVESEMAVYGYGRVSTDGQSLTAQIAELKAAKCERIFQEKISGARADRKQLARVMAVLSKGDVLIVTPARPIGAVNAPSTDNAGHYHEGRRGLQVAPRHMGRHHHGARSPDGDHPGRSG